MDRNGRNDLHHAAARGEVEALRSALAHGDDPGLADKQGSTPLHFAAQQGEVEAARLLLEGGAPLDARDVYGNTPLWRAAFGNNAVPELVRMLLDAGADPHASNNTGRSPRDMAVTFAKPGVVDLFA